MSNKNITSLAVPGIDVAIGYWIRNGNHRFQKGITDLLLKVQESTKTKYS